MKNYSDVVFDDDEKRLIIHFESELHDYPYKYDKEDYLLADLFLWSKTFNKMVQGVQTKYKLSPVSYPEKSNLDEVIRLCYKNISVENFENISKDINSIRLYFHLTENWTFPIRVAIFTNAMLVPISENFRLHIPEPMPYKNATNVKDIRKLSSIYDDPAIKRASRAMDLYKYPSIYFTHKISAEELIQWLKSNRKTFNNIQQGLPKKKKLKISKETLFWGKIAWIIKQDGVESWIGVQNKIDEYVDRIIEDEGEKGNKHLLKRPDNVELRRYYKRFIKYLQKLG